MALQQALNTLKKAKWIDLTHRVTADIPHFHTFEPLKEKTLFTVDKDGFLAKEYQIVSQYGTHIDAPVHFCKGKRYLDDLALRELVLPLFVIHKEKAVQADPDYRLSVQDILDFEEIYGKIPAGSFVAFASGWTKYWKDHKAFYNKDALGVAHTPGWSLEALKFLHEQRNVAAIGHETLDTDSGLDISKNGDIIGERYWLSQDKYQIEVLKNLNRCPAVGGIIFVSFPHIGKAPGFSARVWAIVP